MEPYEDRLAAQVRDANATTYRTAGPIRGYLTDGYHGVRRDLARELLAEALWEAPAGPVLEVGSGPESLLGDAPGRWCVSADLSPGVLDQVKGDPVCLDAGQPLPFRAGCFAAAVMAELIEHLLDPAAVLAELHRVLLPGGWVVLTTPNLAGLQDRLRFLLGRSPRQVDPTHPYLWLHIRPFTASLLTGLLDRAGFTVMAIRSNHVGWQTPSGRWLQSRRLARWVPTLGGSLVVCAQRRP